LNPVGRALHRAVFAAAAMAVAGAVGAGTAGAAAGVGESVVGLGLVPGLPGLNVAKSGGNDVVLVAQGLAPAAYGAPNTVGGSIANGCLGSGSGILDIGDPAQGYVTSSRVHHYVFTFAPGATATAFSLTLLDWADYLPFGASPDHVYGAELTAYAGDSVVSSDELTFTSSSTRVQNRPSNEFGNLGVSGDACTATVGQPGRAPLSVKGSGITRVEFSFRNKASVDPNSALADLSYALTDMTPPVVSVPSSVSADATGPAGAVVSFDASATDDVDGSLPTTCVPASGSAFAIGDTPVMCQATDTAGNTGSAGFTVHVRGAAEQAQSLLQFVTGIGPGASLAAKIRSIQAALPSRSACGQLAALASEARAQSGKKLTAAQAARIEIDANRIAAVIGC